MSNEFAYATSFWPYFHNNNSYDNHFNIFTFLNFFTFKMYFVLWTNMILIFVVHKGYGLEGELKGNTSKYMIFWKILVTENTPYDFLSYYQVIQINFVWKRFTDDPDQSNPIPLGWRGRHLQWYIFYMFVAVKLVYKR